jgi:hypothetical protein
VTATPRNGLRRRRSDKRARHQQPISRHACAGAPSRCGTGRPGTPVSRDGKIPAEGSHGSRPLRLPKSDSEMSPARGNGETRRSHGFPFIAALSDGGHVLRSLGLWRDPARDQPRALRHIGSVIAVRPPRRCARRRRTRHPAPEPCLASLRAIVLFRHQYLVRSKLKTPRGPHAGRIRVAVASVDTRIRGSLSRLPASPSLTPDLTWTTWRPYCVWAGVLLPPGRRHRLRDVRQEVVLAVAGARQRDRANP